MSTNRGSFDHGTQDAKVVDGDLKLTVLAELKNVSRVFEVGGVVAIKNVCLQIRKGEFVAVTGKSGSGKTTMLHILGGLDRPTTGDVWFNGRSIAAIANLDRWRAENVGVVFQSFYLLPNLTAEENVQLPMLGRGLSDSRRVREARRLLEVVGLADRRDHLPSQLSLGQCQRVALARAIANRPQLLLADEPTGSLDSQSGNEVLELIQHCRRSEGMTIVMITHDAEMARIADRIIRMKDGQIVEQHEISSEAT